MPKLVSRTLVVSILFLVSLSISLWGFHLSGKGILDSLYGCLQLLVLEADFDDLKTPLLWQLEFARFILPLFTVLAIISFLTEYIARQVRFAKILLFPRKTIFFGAGKTARAIARSLTANQRIVVVDKTLVLEQLAELTSRHKVMHFRADCTDISFIRKLSLNKAEDIYVFTGEDHRDLDVALMLAELLVQQKEYDNLPRLIIDIDDNELVQVAQYDARFIKYRQLGGALIWFSTQQQVARQLISKHPVLITSSKEKDPVHVALLGFCAQQQQVLRQIIRTSLYLKSKRLVITVLSTEVAEFEKFMLKNPVLYENANLGHKDDLAVIKHYVISPEVSCSMVLSQALSETSTKKFDCAYVHNDNDYKCLYHSQKMLQSLAQLGLNIRVIALIKGSHLENQTITESFVNNAKIYPNLTVCHAKDILLHQNEAYPGEYSDRLGLMVHTAYSALYRDLQVDENRWDNFSIHLEQARDGAKLEWLTKLSSAFMWSSRYAADHLSIKVRELGFELQDFYQTTGKEREVLINKFTDKVLKHIPDMMELEHRRFVAERLIDGWRYSHSNNKTLSLNKTLIPYVELSEEELNKDEAMIRVLPYLISLT